MTPTRPADLRPGDTYIEHDWALHAIAVDTDATTGCTTVAVAEFGFPLHYSAGSMLDVRNTSVMRGSLFTGYGGFDAQAVVE
jgi:hypothetical protein